MSAQPPIPSSSKLHNATATKSHNLTLKTHFNNYGDYKALKYRLDLCSLFKSGPNQAAEARFLSVEQSLTVL